MKKLISILMICMFIGSIYSCKPREKCPAYGYNKPGKLSKTIQG